MDSEVSWQHARFGGRISVDDLLEEIDTASLNSEVTDYIYENGRTYHRYQEGKYMMPNDQDRLDLHHHIFLLLCGGKLTFVPFKEPPRRVLDVGTGTGIWAQDAAETWPTAEVIGTDLSPIQPSWVWPNCRFEIDDAELDWTFPKDHFNFIHSRNLAQSIRDWPRFINQMYRHTAPGGFVEIVELQPGIYSDDNTIPPNSGIRVFFEHWYKATAQVGIRTPNDVDLHKYLQDAGFQDIQVYALKEPLSPWPKDPHLKKIGQYMLLNAETGYMSYGLAFFTRILGMSVEEVTKVCRAAVRDSYDTKVHMYSFVYHVVARKPFE
ncbi:S-adenosyl-L-methionine-dependent methyltransferase [Choiromyces venosus 120613-1]|uniref:S-adenosyl-L-methionine-dependent methyltransferase n=1 Tax=Choiromyces venosus 120613-1 TaxID=1336337 RepID=A0A3N4J193_9PEZI|nr:S-adenosyl-L-methionine-dependent methyltransferase [Choiromyces venosus 120613-1]